MRIALIAHKHLSARSPEWVANWHAARRAVGRLGADRTINLGDITLDGQTHGDELAFASRLMQQSPTGMRCVPGNHELGDGSGEMLLDDRLPGRAIAPKVSSQARPRIHTGGQERVLANGR